MSCIDKTLYITRDSDESMFKVWDEALHCTGGTWEKTDMHFTRRELNFLGITDKVLEDAVNNPVLVELEIHLPYHEA